MKFPRQEEYWSGLPFPLPRDLLDPGIEPALLALQAGSSPRATREAFWCLLGNFSGGLGRCKLMSHLGSKGNDCSAMLRGGRALCWHFTQVIDVPLISMPTGRHCCADLTDENTDIQRWFCQNHTGYRPFLYDTGICAFATTVNSPQSISKFQTFTPKIV